MPRNCSFRKCTINSRTHPNTRFYSFPISRKDVLQQWIISCEKPNFLELTDNQLRAKNVCEAHFTKNCFMNDTKHRVTQIAVPTEDNGEDSVAAANINSPLLSDCSHHCTYIPNVPSKNSSLITVTTNTRPLTTLSKNYLVSTSSVCPMSAARNVLTIAPKCTQPEKTLSVNSMTEVTSSCTVISTKSFPTTLTNALACSTVSACEVTTALPTSAMLATAQSKNVDTSSKTSLTQMQVDIHNASINSVSVNTFSSLSGEIHEDTLGDSVLTPRKQKLKRKLERQTTLLSKKRVIISRLKTKKRSVDELIPIIEERFPEPAATFIRMQFIHKKQSPYTEKEKRFCLSCFYKSPVLYRHLREQGLHLPSSGTIRKWLQSIPMSTGINQDLLNHIQVKVSKMENRLEKYVTLMFDETVIRILLQYDRVNDNVDGFEDLGPGKRSNRIAKQVLVFMVRGMFYKWKLPISYYLTASSVKSDDLKQIILENITHLQEVGLVVRALVCDQGPNNRAAIRQLGVSMETRCIVVNGCKIHVMYDVPHLIKSVRNNLLKYDIIYDGQRRASLKDIQNIYVSDSRCDQNTFSPKARSLPKLKEQHIEPKNFQKMSVKLATQVFSHSVEAALLTAVATKQIISDMAVDTAVFVGKINKMFDALNCNSLHSRNPFSCALGNSYPNVEEFLLESSDFVDTWKLVEAKANIPPCFHGLSMTIRSIIDLWNELKLQGVEYILTSRLNQDPIENMFSVLRYRGGFNANPSAQQLRNNLKAFFCTHLLKPAQSANCEPDDDVLLSVNSNATTSQSSAAASSAGTYDLSASDSETEELAVHVSKCEETLESCSVRYVAGYIAKKTGDKYQCSACHKYFVSPGTVLENRHNLLLFHKAYFAKEAEVGKLTAPSDILTNVVNIALSSFTEIYPHSCYKNGILKTIFKDVKKKVKVLFPCWFFGPCQKHRIYALTHLLRIRLSRELFWSTERNAVARKSSQKIKNLVHN